MYTYKVNITKKFGKTKELVVQQADSAEAAATAALMRLRKLHTARYFVDCAVVVRPYNHQPEAGEFRAGNEFVLKHTT